MAAVLLVKLFAAPALIGLASLAGRRWGPNVAGLFGGLPLVGGPVVLALWLTQGQAYAVDVARAAPVGVWANIAYMLAFGYASARLGWRGSLMLAWLAYLAVALVLNQLGLANSLLLGLLVLPSLWLSARYGLPRPALQSVPAHLPRIELWARIGVAALLVLSLTGASALLGPTLTGVFAGAPVSATVIPSFTLARGGRDPLLWTLRGFLTGLMGFVVFFLVLGQAWPYWGGGAPVAALVAGVLTGVVATRLARRSS
jgi:hypothetical protein